MSMATTNWRDVTAHKGLQRMSTPSTKADGFISIAFAEKANGAERSFLFCFVLLVCQSK